MGAVTSLFVRKVIRAAGSAVDPRALLTSVGLDPADPGDVGQMVSDAAYYDLLERIAAQIGGPGDFPLRVGASMECDDYGAFGLAWKTAPTLRDSFARAERYWRLLTSVVEYEVREVGADAHFALHRLGRRRLGLSMSNEASLASVLSIIREVSTRPVIPREVHFKHPAAGATRGHQGYFGCPVIFGSDMDALVLPVESLSWPNRLGDCGVTRFLLSHLDAELARLESELPLRDRVREAIALSLSAGVPQMEALARRLGMSKRTLQRRLGEEGLSFHGLVDEARRELAEGLLVQSDFSRPRSPS